jgi:hypothetical protein
MVFTYIEERPGTHLAWATDRTALSFTMNLDPAPDERDDPVTVFWLASLADTPFGKASGSGSVV